MDKTISNPGIIARAYNLGYDQFFRANPNVQKNQPLYAGQVVIIPRKVIIPKTVAPNSILINIAERRLFYHHKPSSKLYVMPVGIGRPHTPTPLGKMWVIYKRFKPIWHVTAQGLQEAFDSGNINHPKVVPPGPDNPLGDYAIHLSKPNYLIHSTNDPSKIGTQNTAGCVNLYPEDMALLFTLISQHTPVEIIHTSFKLNKHIDATWIELHPPTLNSVPTSPGVSSLTTDLSLIDHLITVDEKISNLELSSNDIDPFA